MSWEWNIVLAYQVITQEMEQQDHLMDRGAYCVKRAIRALGHQIVLLVQRGSTQILEQ